MIEVRVVEIVRNIRGGPHWTTVPLVDGKPRNFMSHGHHPTIEDATAEAQRWFPGAQIKVLR